MNRRVHPRVRPRQELPVDIQILGAGFIEMLQARDISIGGIGILVPHQFNGYNVEGEVELVVKLPGQKSFLTKGFIRHRADVPGEARFFGIEFSGLSKEVSARLAAYVEKRIAEGGGL
jgi:hypothetical protein